jgi:hypothetical protein
MPSAVTNSGARHSIFSIVRLTMNTDLQKQIGKFRNKATKARLYAKVLGENTIVAMQEQLDVLPNEQCSLYEELALLRVIAQRRACEWETWKEMPLGEKFKSADKLLAIEIAEEKLLQVLNQVRVMCETAAKIQSYINDSMTITNLSFVLSQIIRSAHKVFGDDARVIEYEEEIRNTLRDTNVIEGTRFSPDQDVLAMINTVPAVV